VTTGERSYQNTNATTNQTWVQSTSQTRSDLYLETITQTEYNTQWAQHNTTKTNSENTAAEDRAGEVGTANVTRATDLKTVETTLGSETGTAETTRLGTTNTARDTFDTDAWEERGQESFPEKTPDPFSVWARRRPYRAKRRPRVA